jgi:hypothetical protein
VKLTQAQRKVVAGIAPELADQLKLEERNQRTIEFRVAELRAIKGKAGEAMRHASTGMLRNSLRHVTDLTAQALDRSRGLGAIPAAERAYQVRITLLDTQPPIFQRRWKPHHSGRRLLNATPRHCSLHRDGERGRRRGPRGRNDRRVAA